MRKLLFISCLLLFIAVKAQNTIEFQVNFESASYKLTSSEITSINNQIKTLLTSPKAYKIEIVGHTDNVGNLEYNQILSQKRANEIASYFKNKGFIDSKISSSWKAFLDPISSNDNEKGKSENRRVTIKMTIENPSLVKNIGGYQEKEVVYKINIAKEQTLNYKTGTKITIPENAFIDKNNKPVHGIVDLSYIEYRDPIDFILGNIGMDHLQNGENAHFNSAGMYKILATQNGEALYLKEGKSIKIDFPLTGNLSDVNFYQYDTISKKWTELSKLNTATTTGYSAFLGNADFIDKDYYNPNSYTNICATGQCEALIAVKNLGVNLSSLPESILEKYNTKNKLTKSDSIKTLEYNRRYNTVNKIIETHKKAINSNLVKIDSYLKRIENNTPSYTIKKITNEGDNYVLNIKFNVKSNVENLDYKNSNWIYNTIDNPKLTDEQFNKNWNYCLITPNENKSFTILLKDSISELNLINLKISNIKIENNNSIPVVKSMNKSYDVQQERIKKLNITKDKLIAKNNILYDKIKKLENNKTVQDSTNTYPYRSNLFCFWRNSKPYMTKEETQLSIQDWMVYFDKNKIEMNKRYSELKIEEACQKQYENIIEQQKAAIAKQQKITTANQNASSVTQSLNISQLGIYNCDQISRLNNPIIVNADYLDEHGNQINPMFIYLVDSTINGILKYDGYMQYGPLHFAFSPSSSNTLLAFDDKGDSYIVNSKNFNESIADDKQTATFRMTKIEGIANKSDLNALF